MDSKTHFPTVSQLVGRNLGKTILSQPVREEHLSLSLSLFFWGGGVQEASSVKWFYLSVLSSLAARFGGETSLLRFQKKRFFLYLGSGFFLL